MTKSTKNLFELTGKVAIITGSSKGIGLAIASAFAEYGAHVVLSSRSQEAVDKAAEELSNKGYSTMPQVCHVGDESQRKNLVNKTLERFGRLDILVNNAAINPVYEPLEQMTDAVYDKMMNVNVLKICGEIDIAEHIGNEENKIFGTLHYPGNSGGNANGDTTIISNATSEFHDYEVQWTDSSIKFYVDGVEYHSFINNSNVPFNQDFFLILNTAMGGDLGGAIDPDFDQSTFEIDYIRVYQ